MVDRILIEDGYLVIKVKEFYAYNIAMDWLDTKEKVVEWVEHLNKKKWFTDDDLDCFLNSVNTHFGGLIDRSELL